MKTKKQAAAKQAAVSTEPEARKKPTVAEWMAQEDATEAAATKATKKAKASAKPKATADTVMPKAKASDDLVVFAFRLSADEREEIHAAAGSARASRFVRAVALAAARRDVAALNAIMLEAHREAASS